MPRASTPSLTPVLVLDYDKTLADEHGHVPQAALDALDRWRAAGGIVIDNTGRRAGDFLIKGGDKARALEAENGGAPVFPELAAHVDYIVVENGSGVIDVAADRMLLLGERPLDELLQRLETEFPEHYLSPYRVQCVMTATRAPDAPANDPNLLDDPHVAHLTALVAEMNAKYATHFHVAQNIDALMVLPDGIDKATGLMKALELAQTRGHHLGRIVGGGDALNDLPFLDCADVSFGVERGARLDGHVDFIATALMGLGVAEVADATMALSGTSGAATDTALAAQFRTGRPWNERMRHALDAPVRRADAAAGLASVESRAGIEVREHLGLQRMAELAAPIAPQLG